MSTTKVHTIESAPAESKALLEDSVKAFGYIPNLHGVLAESPGLLQAYKSIHELFVSSSFDKDELTVVWQTINVEHGCHYCVPAHTAIAHMMKVDQSITNALRNKTTLPSDKLQALHEMTLKIVRNRGVISNEDLKAFYDAGYTQRHVFDIILGLSQKIISNYSNHIAQTPIDDGFKKFEWNEETVGA